MTRRKRLGIPLWLGYPCFRASSCSPPWTWCCYSLRRRSVCLAQPLVKCGQRGGPASPHTFVSQHLQRLDRPLEKVVSRPQDAYRSSLFSHNPWSRPPGLFAHVFASTVLTSRALTITVEQEHLQDMWLEAWLFGEKMSPSLQTQRRWNETGHGNRIAGVPIEKSSIRHLHQIYQ